MAKTAIRTYLKENGITHLQFANTTGISYETVRKIIYGSTKIPSIQSMKMICNAYPELDPNTIYKPYIKRNDSQNKNK